jgi:hypothetical protein
MHTFLKRSSKSDMDGVMKFGTKDVRLVGVFHLHYKSHRIAQQKLLSIEAAFMIISDFDVVQVHKTVVSLSVTQRKSEQKLSRLYWQWKVRAVWCGVVSGKKGETKQKAFFHLFYLF